MAGIAAFLLFLIRAAGERLPIPTAAAPLPVLPPCGDVFATLAKMIGAERLTRWWEKKTGRACGCADRRRAMNDACARIERWARRLGGILR